ncbi:MAG: LysM domain-containing protein [Deltaproteobacteria bacterium]
MAFLESSRYHGAPVAQVEADGRTVTVVKPRRAPPAGSGEPHRVDESDRLDRLALERLGDATRFWRIADVNSELEADALLVHADEDIEVPRS